MLDESTIKTLINAAREVRNNAHAPYSNYKVGAALLSAEGNLYTGVNNETVVQVTTHAERMAIDDMVKHGDSRVVAVAVVTDDEKRPFPCGGCLQAIIEFSSKTRDVELFASNLRGEYRKKMLYEVITETFGPDNLA